MTLYIINTKLSHPNWAYQKILHLSDLKITILSCQVSQIQKIWQNNPWELHKLLREMKKLLTTPSLSFLQPNQLAILVIRRNLQPLFQTLRVQQTRIPSKVSCHLNINQEAFSAFWVVSLSLDFKNRRGLLLSRLPKRTELQM
jgi:hypothetical protein